MESGLLINTSRGMKNAADGGVKYFLILIGNGIRSDKLKFVPEFVARRQIVFRFAAL